MTGLLGGGLHGLGALVGALVGAPAAIIIFWVAWRLARKD